MYLKVGPPGACVMTKLLNYLLRNSPINCSMAQAGVNDFDATCVNISEHLID